MYGEFNIEKQEAEIDKYKSIDKKFESLKIKNWKDMKFGWRVDTFKIGNVNFY